MQCKMSTCSVATILCYNNVHMQVVVWCYDHIMFSFNASIGNIETKFG